jgi:hypothetical protein
VKQDELYDMIEKELSEVHKTICSVCAVPISSSSLETIELGDDPSQLHRLAYETEVRLQRVQEEKEKAIESLKKEKEEILEQL